MKLRTLFKYLILCFSSFRLCNATMSNLKLELVQVIFRHGARTPSRVEADHINATDPTFYLPEGYHQLTNEGKLQAYRLGTLLRKKYDEFIGAYNPEEYQATSSAYTRTVMSLQETLAGLFPNLPRDTLNNKIHQNSLHLDIILAPHQSQKFKDLYLETIANSSEFQQKLSKYTTFLETMENNTGFPFRENLIYHTGWTYYAIKYHKAMNLPLPNWYTDDSIYTNLAQLFKLTLDGMSWTPQLRRINGGTLVRQLIDNINNNRRASLPKKMYFYCAHDLTIYAFSKAQDFEAFYLPPYGSALIMEKYTDSQKSEYVRMLAWDAVGENFVPVKMGNCEEFCKLEDYMKIVKNNVASDEDLAYLKEVTNEGNTFLNV